MDYLLVWITKEGASWRAIPKVYGYWNTIYRRFGRWCDAGVFQALHEHFNDAGEITLFLLIARWYAPILVQPVCLKKRGQETQALGRTLSGFTSKLNLSLSDEWIPLRFTLTAGQCNDITQASELIKGYSYQYVIGDKAYDSDAFIAEITSQDAVAVIPPRKNRTQTRTYNKGLYKLRNIIDGSFVIYFPSPGLQ